MPANLTPDYQRAEQACREAKTAEEKLAALEEMLATIPKHKGTEKMQADIKRRIAKLRADQTVAKKGKHFDPYHIERSGAGQVVLIGAPNVGKSAIVGALTNAPVVVEPYPFATHAPVPGMAAYEDIQIQLVDMPPYTEHGFPPGMVGAIRGADVIGIVVDGSAANALEQLELGLKLLRERKIVPEGSGQAKHERTGADEGDIVWEKKMLVLLSKTDLASDTDASATLKELYGHLEFLPISTRSGENLQELLKRIFELLHVVRVYAKPPGKKPDMDQPFVLKAGSTVTDLAREIHRDFAHQLKSARVWGNGKYPGQQVPKDYVLEDKDILEIHV